MQVEGDFVAYLPHTVLLSHWIGILYIGVCTDRFTNILCWLVHAKVYEYR